MRSTRAGSTSSTRRTKRKVSMTDNTESGAYRLANCPRCSRKAMGIRTKTVPKTDTQMSPDLCDPSDPLDFETEEWVIYEPCGCEIPPEEHEDRLRDAQ